MYLYTPVFTNCSLYFNFNARNSIIETSCCTRFILLCIEAYGSLENVNLLYRSDVLLVTILHVVRVEIQFLCFKYEIQG